MPADLTSLVAVTGPTHVLGGVTALAAYSLATGQVEHVPLWAFGVAALSALVPDSDNGQGSMLNRPHLIWLKAMTVPLWARSSHRGRTHSLLGGVGLYSLIILGWVLALNLAGQATGHPLNLAPWIVVAAAAVGYTSHLALDLLNTKGLQLLWPLPLRFVFPPWRALRFTTGSLREEFLVSMPMFLFLGWFTVVQGPQVVSATAADKTVFDLVGALLGVLGDLFHRAIEYARSR